MNIKLIKFYIITTFTGLDLREQKNSIPDVWVHTNTYIANDRVMNFSSDEAAMR